MSSSSIELVPVSYKRFDADNPPLPTKLYRLAAAIMVRDEAQFVRKTIDSAAAFVDCFVICDTGSSDDTISVVKRACVAHATPCFVLEIPWIQFGPSRNHLMDFVERIAEFALCLDASDEVREDKDGALARTIDTWPEDAEKAYVRIQWNNYSHSFARLLKTSFGCRYAGVRHNFVVTSGGKTLLLSEADFYLYQDRSTAKQSTSKFKEDAKILLNEHRARPDDTRTVFYLAQSLKDSGELRDAYKYYLKRAHMNGGYKEEIYVAFWYCAALSKQLGMGFAVERKHLSQAFETIATRHCALQMARACRDANRMNEEFVWLSAAAKSLPYKHLELMHDILCEGPKRWFLYASACYRMGMGREAIDAYAAGQREYLTGEYGRRVLEGRGQPNAAADCFDVCWKQWGSAHPEWFSQIPAKWLSEETAQARWRALEKDADGANVTNKDHEDKVNNVRR